MHSFPLSAPPSTDPTENDRGCAVIQAPSLPGPSCELDSKPASGWWQTWVAATAPVSEKPGMLSLSAVSSVTDDSDQDSRPPSSTPILTITTTGPQPGSDTEIEPSNISASRASKRRRTQNRIAQPGEKVQQQKDCTQGDTQNQQHASSAYHIPDAADCTLDGDGDLFGLTWDELNMWGVATQGHASANNRSSFGQGPVEAPQPIRDFASNIGSWLLLDQGRWGPNEAIGDEMSTQRTTSLEGGVLDRKPEGDENFMPLERNNGFDEDGVAAAQGQHANRGKARCYPAARSRSN